MGYLKRTNDWEAVGLVQMGGAVGAAAGAWMFHFQSHANNFGCAMGFFGGGVGEAGSIGGTTAPNWKRIYEDLLKKKGPKPPVLALSKIQCDREFSASDLNWSFGTLGWMGASLSIGYSNLVIRATNTSGSLFSGQECGGWGFGVGAGALYVVGVWKWIANQNIIS